MKLFLLFAFNMFILWPGVKAADTLQYSLRQYTDENGLPQNSIKSIAPDRFGFLWMATENGLVRFDGQQFRVFDKHDTGLPASRITWLASDPSRQGLFAITEKNQCLAIENGEARLLQPGQWPAIFDTLTFDGHLSVYHTLGLPNIYRNILRFRSYRIDVDPTLYYTVTGSTVEAFHNKEKFFETTIPGTDCWNYFLLEGQLYCLDGYDVTRIADGKISKGGPLRGDIQQNPAFRAGKVSPVLYWNWITGSAFVYLGSSLYLLKPLPGGGLVTHLLLENFDMDQNSIMSIYYDETARRLFLGSQTRGLFVFTRKQFYTLRSDQSDADEVYYAQAAYGHDEVLTPQGDLLALFRKGKRFPIIHANIKTDRYSMLIDQQGNIWCKQRSVLFRYGRDGKTLLGQWQLPTQITQLYEYDKGHLLIGLRYGVLHQLDYMAPSPKPRPVLDAVLDISFMQMESFGILWIGTAKGLYRANLITNKIDTIPGLHTQYIRSILISKPGELWITAYGDGIYLLKDNKPTRMPMDKDRFLSAAHCILEDGKGFFWITTNKGLFQVARKDLLAFAADRQQAVYYLYYDKYAGFNTNEFNGGCQPCGIKMPNGYLSLPSINGLVWGHPATLRAEAPDKGLFLDKLEIDGQPLHGTDTISLEQQFDFFKLSVTTPYFGHPYNVHLEFALVKNQSAPVWNKIDNDRSITLTSLPSGTYQLQIRKQNGFGPDNYSMKVITLIIPLAFYETWWFRIALGLLIVASIWIYTRFRLQYIKRKNKMLEARIDERTQTLLNTLTELQESEEVLRRQTHIQDRLITAITHDIKSPLKYMTMAARRMFENADLESAQEMQKNARMLYESGYRMYHLTDNLLQYIKLNSRDTHIIYEGVNVHDLVEDKVELFRDIAAEQSTNLYNEVPANWRMRSNNRLLGVVVHNLVDNAIKVTFDGQLTIDTVEEKEEVRIRLNDTGVGMHPDMVHWCNSDTDPYEMTPAGEKFPGHAGFGLIIVKELVNLMNGKLQVSSSQAGTTIELIFHKDMKLEV